MLRRAHAHSVRWTLGRCRHSMLYRYCLWTKVPPLWSFKIGHNVLTSKQLYSWRLLIWELLAAPLDMGKDVQMEQELPAGSSAAASCWCDPAEVGTQTHRTAQPGGHTGVTAEQSTAQRSLKALLGELPQCSSVSAYTSWDVDHQLLYLKKVASQAG